MADAVTENEVVEIDENIQLTEAEVQAVEEFITEVSNEGILGEGDDVNEEDAIRFLRARKFDVERAVSLFIAHKDICAKFDLEDLTPFKEPLWSELLSGKFTVLPGKDLAGASVCLFTERLHFPKQTTHKAVLKSIIFQLNEITKREETQLNGIVLIYDMKWASLKNFDYELCRKTLSLLKGAFPARLKHVYILSAPLWFRATLSILSSLLREKIRNRVEVLKNSVDLLTRIPASTIPVHFGGEHLVDHESWLDQCVGNYERPLGGNGTQASSAKEICKPYKSRNFNKRLEESSEFHENSTPDFFSHHSSRVYEFIDHVAKVGRNEIYEEYRCIKSQPPLGTFQSSRHPFNMSKNRYKDVPCFDESRVKLEIINEDDVSRVGPILFSIFYQFSDYINASYVDGFLNGSRQENAYICTQGPLENTCFDFWRMVLQEQARVIVMITRCVERRKEKCFKYWPDEGETIDFEFLSVKNSGETISEDYVTRNFEIHHKKISIVHNVRQLQFTSWPDFGVLSSASKFLNILNEVRKFQNITENIDSELAVKDSHEHMSKSPPLVVHCSAGIGRTGTFIAIDISTRGIEHSGVINVPSVVHDIRRRRAFCVQTEEQYAFCYSVVLEFILQKMKNSGESLERIENCLRVWHGERE